MAGRLLVLEGLDGSGVHEIAKWVFDILLERYQLKERWLTKEPTEGPVGLILRLAIDGRLILAPEAFGLFFAADRTDHIYRPDGIKTRLEKGEIVVSDRYYLSSYAYQTSNYELGSEEHSAHLRWLRIINEQWCPVPDLTIFIDQPVESCVQRLLDEQRELGHYQATKIDLQDPSTWESARVRLERVRRNYLKAIEALTLDHDRGETIRIIGSGDVELTKEKIQREIRNELDPLLRT